MEAEHLSEIPGTEKVRRLRVFPLFIFAHFVPFVVPNDLSSATTAMTFDPAVFPRQLRFWTLHCLLNAAPSLGIALGWLGLWRSTPAVVAMFTAIATFILLYAALTSLRGPLTDPGHILARALHLGTRIRAWITGLSLLVLPTGVFMVFTPDYWCGMLAIGLLNSAARHLGMAGPFFSPDPAAATSGFLPVYATTLLEGFILSFFLLMISFFALIFLQMRDRRKAFAGAGSPAAPR